MQKLVVFNMISLDGFFAGEDGNIDWHQVDDEFNTFAVEHTKTFGTIIFGKTTYQLFESFWPKAIDDSTLSPEDHAVAKVIDDAQKIVFSTSLKEVTWRNTQICSSIDPEEVRRWKEQADKDIVIFGSGLIVQQMTELGLIDEYRLMMNPIVLGKGKPMFAKQQEILTFKLLNTRTFHNGNVLLSYTPAS